MANKSAAASPQVYARIGGMAYLIIIVAGAIGEMFIRNKMIVTGNAAATASNITASPLLWRISIAGDLVMHVFDLVLAMVYYFLFRPVNKNLARLSLFFGLIQTAVLVANKMTLVVPLLLLRNAGYLQPLDTQQLQAFSFLSIQAHEYGFGIGLVFFGVSCLIDGYLIFISGFLPKVLGVLLQIAGICYLVNSFAMILSPRLANLLFPAILVPAFISELSVCLWLLIKGVNVSKWKEWVAIDL